MEESSRDGKSRKCGAEEDRPKRGKKWHLFQVICPRTGRAILRGSTSTIDKRFKPLSRGRQASAASVVALVYANLFEPRDWQPSYVDRSLEYGDRLYRMSRTIGRFGDDDYITTSQLQQEFFVGDYKCQICTEPGAVFGNMISDTATAPSFPKGLRRFLQLKNFGVLTSQATSVAIWSHPDHGFFYFDPAPTDEQGIRCPSGVACVIRASQVDDIMEIFRRTLNNPCDTRYCIDRVRLNKLKDIGRGKFEGQCGGEVTFDKKSQKPNASPEGLEDAKLDCTKALLQATPAREEQLEEEPEAFKKTPLTIEITNCAIEAKLAATPLADQLLKDEKFTYEDAKVNVPTTLQPTPADENVLILHGMTHELGNMYKAKSAGTSCYCVMAFVMRVVNPVRCWVRKTLDEVLARGDELYAAIREEKPSLKKITSADLDAAHVKLENRKLLVDVDLLTVIGTIMSKVPTVLSIKQGLEKFFENNKDGVIEVSSFAVSIWFENDYYYMFDPRACDINGVLLKESNNKNGKADGKEKKAIGKCCVMRFPDLNAFADHYLKNLDSGLLSERYTIRRIGVVDDVPGVREWNSFQPGGLGKSWIILGTMNRDDDSFSDHSRDVQGMAMPVVALVAAKTIPPAKWNEDEVDETIQYGDDFFVWCIPPSGEARDNEVKDLNLKNMKKQLYYKKCKAAIEVNESVIIGDMSVSNDDKKLNLERGIKEFFNDHQYGFIEANNTFFAIWTYTEELKDKSKETSYYLFNDKPNEFFFQKIPLANPKTSPHACLLRFLDPREISQLLIDELYQPEDENSQKEFFIHEIKLASISAPMTNSQIEQDKSVPVRPELRAYTSMGDYGASLNGNFNQANDSLFKKETRNKQQAANALVTLGMTKLYDPHLWRSEVVDDILKMGDQLSAKNAQNISDISEESDEPRNYLNPTEIDGEFQIGVNTINVAVEEEVVSGANNDAFKTFDEFFATRKVGIYRLDEVILPIWKEGNVFFTMDPVGSQFATVYWVMDLHAFIDLVIGITHRHDSLFVIDAVTVENSVIEEMEEEEEEEPSENQWFNFSRIYEGVWKIDCSLAMDNERFKEENRGKQSAAISVMGIIFSKLYEPRHMSTEILDEITITGDKLHSRSAQRIGKNKSFHPKDLIVEFFLSNRRIKLNIQDCVEAGTLGGRGSKVQDISSGISKFFKKFPTGCLTLPDNMNLAIWTYDGEYYSLTPGTSIKRYENETLLVDDLRLFGENLDFEITNVDVVDWNKSLPWKYDPSPAVRPSNLPSYNAYSKLPGKARAILRGFSHQASEIFAEDIRGHQTASNCIVAIAMAVITNPTTWTRKRLDEILALGVTLHRESLKFTDGHSPNLKPKDIVRIFHIGANVLAVDVETAVTGIVAPPPPEPEEKGKKKPKPKKKKGKGRERPPPPPPILLEDGFKKFLSDEKNNACILSTGRYMVAVWKESGVYFMYDPRARNNQGLKVDDESDGTSCVTWFACVEPLYELLAANICDDEKYAKFELSRVIVRTVPIEPLPSSAEYQAVHGSRKVGEPMCPEPAILPAELQEQLRAPERLQVDLETLFERLDEEASILLGSKHMGSWEFGLESRGHQSSAIALAAIAVAAVHAPSTWSPSLVDAVLRHGDSLHTECARLHRPGPRNLSVAELLELFVFGDVRARVRIRPGLAAGLSLEHDLAAGLEVLLAGHHALIFHTANFALPVLQHWGKYYFLDPSNRNRFSPSFDGAACLVKCESLGKLASLILRVCSFAEPTVYTLNPVEILDLYFYTR